MKMPGDEEPLVSGYWWGGGAGSLACRVVAYAPLDSQSNESAEMSLGAADTSVCATNIHLVS
jgi:hypothetical protein